MSIQEHGGKANDTIELADLRLLRAARAFVETYDSHESGGASENRVRYARRRLLIDAERFRSVQARTDAFGVTTDG